MKRLHPVVVGLVAWLFIDLFIALVGDFGSRDCGRDTALTFGILAVVFFGIFGVFPAVLFGFFAADSKQLRSVRLWGGLMAVLVVAFGVLAISEPKYSIYVVGEDPPQCRIDL